MGRALAAGLALVILTAGHAGAQQADQFFDATTLHNLDLTLHADDWRRLQENYLSDDYYPAYFSWNGVQVRNVGIRSRGNASRDPNKPGLRVDFDRYVTDQEFLGLKSFVLDNLAQDSSGIMERVTMATYARMGLPAPREAHARLSINGQYLGLYTIVESIDRDFLERAYAARGQETGRPERDGVLLDYQHNYEYFFTYLGSDISPYMGLFEPETHETESPEMLYGPFRELTRAIDEASDADVATRVNEYLDLNQWIRYVAVEMFLAEIDGMFGFAGMNNFYLYRFQDTNLSQVIPWDKDQAFDGATRSIWHNAGANRLMQRVMAVPALRSVYLQALLDCATAAALTEGEDPRGWLERQIEGAFEQIRESMETDTAKLYTNEAFHAEVERLRQFARIRSVFVQCEVNNELGGGEPRDCSSVANGGGGGDGGTGGGDNNGGGPPEEPDPNPNRAPRRRP